MEMKSLSLSSYYSLKYLFVAGEHCDQGTRLWTENQFQVPVLNHWWQTETGHAITATCVGLGNKLNPPKVSTGRAVPGKQNKNTKLQLSLMANASFDLIWSA